MQYVRNLSDSVSTAWNTLNPSTLSGACDVIVVEQEDGTFACSPFHVRFGKFSLLRPYEKKVEFKVNGAKQDYAMKLGEGGEAFFIFETSDAIPQSLQTSPLVSPASSPPLQADRSSTPGLQEPPLLELDADSGKPRSASTSLHRPPPAVIYSSSAPRENALGPLSTSPELSHGRPASGDWSSLGQRYYSEGVLRQTARKQRSVSDLSDDPGNGPASDRSHSPFPPSAQEAVERAINLSKELEAVNIPSKVTETGDLVLDMTGFKQSDEDALRAEILARRVLSEELEGNYDIGALFGIDEDGNLWIYSSEEAKDAAMKRAMEASLRPGHNVDADAASDPGYHSDESNSTTSPLHRRTESDAGPSSIQTPPTSPGSSAAAGEPSRSYAKTLRLTSDQLKALRLTPGENSMSFTVNRATCHAYMFLWRQETPVVISDIDGTITKSDALGQVLNMIGRDWTHAGVAKLYSDIVTNGYNIMYLSSRSIGQSDTTRAYLHGIAQDGYKLPRGPTILSPDRTMAALRREIYLRKPQIFKMATLRDIRALYGAGHQPFYAGFGNRLTDQISYRTVDVPRTRIFTINSNAEVSLDLLSLNKLKLSYVNMSEVVDHYFPPVSTLVKGGGEEYTDFTYWRDAPLDLDEFSASGTEDDEDEDDEDEDEDEDEAAAAAAAAAGPAGDDAEQESEYDEYDDEAAEGMGDSYLSRDSAGEDAGYGESSVFSGSYEEGDDDADDEGEELERELLARAEKELPPMQRDHHAAPAPAADDDEKAPNRPKVAVHDVNAEVITGVESLQVVEEVGK